MSTLETVVAPLLPLRLLSLPLEVLLVDGVLHQPEVLQEQHPQEAIVPLPLPQVSTLGLELGDDKPITTLNKASPMVLFSSTIWEARGRVFLTCKLTSTDAVSTSLTLLFSRTWGNSLSYAGANAKTGSASPVTLADTLIDDNNEVIIMTDKPCNGDCGAVRDGTVAYRKPASWTNDFWSLTKWY